MKINILIADDDALIRESLKIIFEMDDRFQVMATVSNGREAVEFISHNPVDVAVLDVRMPVMNGVEATALIVKEYQTRVMILTTFDEDAYIEQALKFGASGYLLKNSPPDAIKHAVIAVHSGNTVIQDVVMQQLNTSTHSRDEKFDLLTQREMEVVALIAKGLTNGEIAARLYISEGTVKNTVSNILSKLELKHRTQIAIAFLT